VITVCKASAVGDQVVESVVLRITEDSTIPLHAIPDEGFEGKAEAHYAAQAELVLEALRALPMGTRHQLLAKLLGPSDAAPAAWRRYSNQDRYARSRRCTRRACP
jgi:hypothetical protein